MTSSLLQELGGADGVAETVDDLYRRLLADPEIAPLLLGGGPAPDPGPHDRLPDRRSGRTRPIRRS